MNVIQATNTPVKLKLSGSDYPVRCLNFRELAVLSTWIEEHVPSPLARALQAIGQLKAAGKAPDAATEETMLDHATNASLSWPPRVGSKPWLDALDGAEGGLAELAFVILSKTIPDFDREKAQVLIEKILPQEFLELTYLGVYGIRLKKDEAAETNGEPEPVGPAAESKPPETTPEPKLQGTKLGDWRE
jgi:hypothetical protein